MLLYSSRSCPNPGAFLVPGRSQSRGCFNRVCPYSEFFQGSSRSCPHFGHVLIPGLSSFRGSPQPGAILISELFSSRGCPDPGAMPGLPSSRTCPHLGTAPLRVLTLSKCYINAVFSFRGCPHPQAAFIPGLSSSRRCSGCSARKKLFLLKGPYS